MLPFQAFSPDPTDLLPTAEEPGRILVVDDHPTNLKVLKLEFRGHPFDLTLCASGEEALAAAEGQAFEGILMDVSLPIMDGIEICRRIRKSELNAHTPLIFLSAMRVGEDWITKGLEAGGMDYLTKPYVFSELLAKLRVMVRISRMRDRLLVAERQRVVEETAGGMAHGIAQPLASAQLVLDQMERQEGPASPVQLAQLRECLTQATKVLRQIQNLRSYVTKPYAGGQILDLEGSAEPPSPGGDA